MSQVMGQGFVYSTYTCMSVLALRAMYLYLLNSKINIARVDEFILNEKKGA
jgi:hypothetical protein